jgi:type II secretory pathway component PulF
LLKLLYSTQIRAGMTAKEALPIIQAQLAQWQRDGTLTDADKTVRQGELYPLLGY